MKKKNELERRQKELAKIIAAQFLVLKDQEVLQDNLRRAVCLKFQLRTKR